MIILKKKFENICKVPKLNELLSVLPTVYAAVSTPVVVNEPRNGQSVNLPNIRGMLLLLRVLGLHVVAVYPKLNIKFVQ